MKKFIISLTTLSLLFASSLFACDTSDPICVTSKIIENNTIFNAAGLRPYYCKEDQFFMKIVENMAATVEESYKDKQHQYSDLIFDFSKVKYKIIDQSEKKTTISVTGTASARLNDGSFFHEDKMESKVSLFKIGDSWLFCPSMERNQLTN